MSISRSFVAPFAIGTLLGILSGTVIGTLFGNQIFSTVVSAWSFVDRRNDDQVPFDLLLQ